MSANPYDILGIEKNASQADIKKAYRKLSKEWHPDRHKGDAAAEKKYKEINQAYELLNDPKKRQAYDQYGSADGPSFGNGAPFGGGFGGFSNMDDIFETFFGGASRGGGHGRQNGKDQEVAVSIRLREAYVGLQKTVRIRSFVSCEVCKGSGAQEGAAMVTCSDCHGSGQVTRSAQSFFGVIQQSVLCDRCRGAGSVPEKPCTSCSGEGRLSGTHDVVITVPAGISDGQTLKLSGKGEAGRQGASSGDLYVHVHVEHDPVFRRSGDDLHTETAVPAHDAVLGGEATIESFAGPITLKIPAGSQPHQTLRVKGKGMPVLNTSRFGDLYVSLNIQLPSKLSRREKELWEQLRDGK